MSRGRDWEGLLAGDGRKWREVQGTQRLQAPEFCAQVVLVFVGQDLGLSGLGTPCTSAPSQWLLRQCQVGGLLRDMGRKQILVTGFRSQTAGYKREHHSEEGGDTGVWSMFALGGEGADDGMQAKVWRIWSKNVCVWGGDAHGG